MKQDKYFVRQGADLFVQVPVSMTQAALGLGIEIDNLEGKTVKVELPAGLQNGKIVRVKGEGLPKYKNPGSKGDLYVKFQIETPKRLGLKARQIMKELSDAMGENSHPSPVPFQEE